MAHEAFLSGIGQLEIAGEASAFATEGTNYTHVRTMPIDRSGLTVATFRDEFQRQIDTETSRIIGPHGGSITTEMYLHGFSSTVPVAAPTHTSTAGAANGFDFILDILAGAIGNLSTGGFTSGETGSDTSTIKAPDLTSFTIGQALGYEDANNDWHVNFATSNTAGATDEIDLLQTAQVVPDGTVLGAHTIYQTTGSPFFDGSVKSFSLRYTGHADDDRTVMLGCWPGNVSINMPVAGLPTVSIDWMVSHWHEDALATNLGIHSGVGADNGGPTATGAWAFPQCEAVTQAHVSWGTSQANTRQVQGIALDMGVEVQPIQDPNSTSAVGGWYVTKRTPKITLQVMRDVAEEITDFFSQTGKTLTAWAGSQGGKLVCVSMPNARIEEWGAPTDSEGSVMASLTFVGNEYTADTGTITADNVPGDKQFRLAFL